MTTTDPKPTTESVPPGNVGKVAMRVDALRSVTQTRGSFVVLGEAGEPPYMAEFVRPAWAFERKGETRLVVTGTFALTGQKETPDSESGPIAPKVFVRIEAEYVAEYELSAGDPFSDEDATAFANVNAHLNLHPFWREYVYSSLGRARLPALLIPPFNPIKASSFKRKPTTPAAPSPSSASSQ